MGLPSWVSDGEAKPAPAPLLLVQSFVNTWEADSGADLLADPAIAGRWLGDAGLLEGKLGVAGGSWRRPAKCGRASGRSWYTTVVGSYQGHRTWKPCEISLELTGMWSRWRQMAISTSTRLAKDH